jgi:CheY-like chemotaxis protein
MSFVMSIGFLMKAFGPVPADDKSPSRKFLKILFSPDAQRRKKERKLLTRKKGSGRAANSPKRVLMTKRILVADDHASVRRCLRMLIAQRQDWQVCAEADDGVDAVEKAKSLSPDVAVLDIAMGRLNGLDAAQEIRARCPATIVLTTSMYDAEPLFSKLQTIGVKGFIPKNNLAIDLLPAIDAALTGQSWFRATERSYRSGRLRS